MSGVEGKGEIVHFLEGPFYVCVFLFDSGSILVLVLGYFTVLV